MIDDPASVSAYPPALLRKWKDEQLKEFAKVQTGWALATDAAKIVLGQDSSTPAVIITNSNLELGGEGGKAPGAGGGGGGAIGPGSKAGRGGTGGNSYVDAGPFTLPMPNEGNVPGLEAGLDNPAPGSGGGGAGAMGKNAIAGDGGDGGDHFMASIDLEALISAGFSGEVKVEVGEAGKAATLPGELPQNGGPSIVRFMHHDGTVLKEIRAKGGTSAGPRLPDGVREVVESDFAGGLQVTTLMPVNAAELRGGLAYVLGGDWRWMALPSLPADMIVNVLCFLRWRTLEIGADGLGFHLFLVSPAGIRMAHQPLIVPPEFKERNIQFLVPVGAIVTEIGEYSIQVISGEFLFAEAPFDVQIVGQSDRSILE